MFISIEHKDGKYPQFNVNLHSSEGMEPFLVIKGCRIANGSNGQFVSGPSTKNGDGRYWNHTYFNEKFAAAVLAKAMGDGLPQAPRQAPPKAFKPASQDAFKARQLAPQQQYDNEEPPF